MTAFGSLRGWRGLQPLHPRFGRGATEVASNQASRPSEPESTQPPPEEPRSLHGVLYDPWTIAVGGGLALAGVIALLVWLL
jgi:hypothetical protein